MILVVPTLMMLTGLAIAVNCGGVAEQLTELVLKRTISENIEARGAGWFGVSWVLVGLVSLVALIFLEAY
ncbi:hypothetical protein [Streptomyces albus]|uniref:hypothetical protein n=1 Tax=Streptomyces albus TaxID=1888 RepID=UPI00131E1B9B|nr:hypothetical protein [Streptomyces albus]